jgi:capsular exopolysaccharide synthesis family protein
VIWRQRWLIATSVIVCLFIAILYLLIKKPLYASTAKICVQPAGVRLLATGQSAMGQAGSGNFLPTQKELVTSEPVLAIASSMPKVAQTATMQEARKPVLYLKDIVTTDLEKDKDIIHVTAYSPSADDAAAIANGIVEAYMAYQTKPKWTNQSDHLAALKAEKARVEGELQQKAAQLTALEMKFGILGRKDDRSNIRMHRLQSLTDALHKAKEEAQSARADYEELVKLLGPRMAALNVDPADVDDLPISSPQELAVIQSERLQATVLLQELQQRFGPEHPAVVRARQRVSRLNLTMASSIQRRHQTSQRRVADLEAEYEAEQRKVIENDAHANEYARLQDDVDRLKKMRDEYDGGIRSIEFAREAGGLTIEVAEAAQPKATPAIPGKLRTFGYALAIGTVLGIMLACMREWIDDRYGSTGDIKSSVGMPLLAVIPQTTIRRSPSVSGQRILLDPASDAAEAYRTLRTAVQFAAPPGQVKTLVVTSPETGDGKTTLVSNLAIAMAQGGKKTIIVDADLRKPMQHEIFNCKNGTGLSTLLSGRCSLDTATQRTSVQNLEILPCGPVPANPAEILNSREFGETLEQLAEKYDYVVLDSPPVQAVADARVIAASCDATVLVLKAQTAHRRVTEAARDSLLGVGARIMGVVVNDLPRRPQAAYGQHASSQKRYVPGLTSPDYDAPAARAK